MGQFTSKYEKSHTQQQLSMAFLMPPANTFETFLLILHLKMLV